MQIEGNRFVVTGGAGFIGSHLTDALLERGAHSVVVLDSLELGTENNLADNPRIELFPFRLGQDSPHRLGAALRGASGLFHLAAVKRDGDPERMLATTGVGPHPLLAGARRSEIAKVVFASSVLAYGRAGGHVMEEHERCEPQSVYGVSKLAGEHLLGAVLDPAGIPHVALRYFFVYGPRQSCGKDRNTVVIETLTRLARGEAPRRVAGGEQALDSIYVEDVVRATLLAMVKPADHRTYNVCTGRALRVRDLVEQCRALFAGSRPCEPAPPDATHGTVRVGSPALAARELDFHAEIPVERGLARTKAWLETVDEALLEGILRCSG